MAFVSIKATLSRAKEEQFAVPLFDVMDLNTAMGLIEAAEELDAPLILGVYDQWLDLPDAPAFCAGLRVMAENASVPVAVMLDHGRSFEQCLQAIRLGFSDVMFDGSALPFEENIAVTEMIARGAHAVGVGVEAELGHVGVGSDYDDYGRVVSDFTDPKHVAEFIQASGVDYLAVAFGTAHGQYKSEPKLNLELLKDLNQASTIPLVMHGGSGLSDSQFRGAIENGICKINVATHLFNEAAARIERVVNEKNHSIFSVNKAVRDVFRELGGDYLRLFGAAGKA
ncbi:MAG: class II fructose-bisphosphate aldolase [Anaerolineaceae bacterium]|nr:class II fructose-bisphosphate aldolase [Anaerolineaceae bacterium]